MEITSALILAACEVETHGLSFDAVGDIHADKGDKVLSYLKDPRYAEVVNRNIRIQGVFCSEETAPYIKRNLTKIIVGDPNWAFFSLIDYLGRRKVLPASTFGSDFDAEKTFVADHGVTLGRGVVLEPYVTIYPGTHIADGVIVRSGARLGLDTFQHQRTSRGLISPRHDGELFIGKDVEIGANCAISKGFSYRDTVVDESVKIDANAYIGHGAYVGAGSIICAGACIMGHVVLGHDVFIGPGAVVSSRVVMGSRSRASIGSVVNRNVPDNQAVSGNFAVPHDLFIARLKSSERCSE